MTKVPSWSDLDCWWAAFVLWSPVLFHWLSDQWTIMILMHLMIINALCATLLWSPVLFQWLFDRCTWKLRQCICITCVVMMTSEYDGKDNCRRYFMLFQAVATEINQRSATVVVFQLISCKFPKVFPPNGGICPKCCPIVSRLWELPLLLLYWRPIDSLSRRSPNLRLICIKRSLNSH